MDGAGRPSGESWLRAGEMSRGGGAASPDLLRRGAPGSFGSFCRVARSAETAGRCFVGERGPDPRGACRAGTGSAARQFWVQVSANAETSAVWPVSGLPTNVRRTW